MNKKILFLPKNFFFTLFLFYTGFYFSFIFTDYFQGTDSEFYLSLLESGNVRSLRIEPLFYFLSQILGYFFAPQVAYNVLGLISLTLKSYFVSIFCNKSSNKYFKIIGIVLFYFLVFYNRSEIGSLRNAFGVSIMQFILIVNTFRLRLFISLIAFMFHFYTGFYSFFVSLLLYILQINNINTYQVINSLLLSFQRLKFNINYKISKSKISKNILIVFLIIGTIVLSTYFKANIIRALLGGLKEGTNINLRYVTFNPFIYYRSYIILFNFIGLFLILRCKYENIIKKFNFLSLQNQLNFNLINILIILFLSFLPLLSTVQRLSFIFIYFTSIFNIYYGIDLLLHIAKRTKVKPIITLSILFLSVSLFINSFIIYKFLRRAEYDKKIEESKMQIKRSLK